MAENDVFIEGGNWPAWATEDTQNQILNALLAAGVSGLKKGDLQKLIEAIGKGDKDVSQILKDIKVEDLINRQEIVVDVKNIKSFHQHRLLTPNTKNKFKPSN